MTSSQLQYDQNRISKQNADTNVRNAISNERNATVNEKSQKLAERKAKHEIAQGYLSSIFGR